VDDARAPGETDLDAMLATLDVVRRPGVFTFVAVDAPGADQLAVAAATIVEDEAVTLVMQVDDARRFGLPVVVEMAWLTLTVNSSLEAVGLTAAFSRTLADAGVSCNVLAGFHHDHLLVPASDVDRAIEVLRA
jgi:uncharacterized protein